MNWIMIILLTILVVSTINLLIMCLSKYNFFFQVLYVFIFDNENWKKYQRLKKYLKTNTIPIINLLDYEGGNSSFAFVQYNNEVFIIQGDNLYLSPYYNHLIKNLLKHNNHDS